MRASVGYEGIKVLGARLVVKPIPESDVTQSGLLVTGKQEPKYEGTIVGVGPGARMEDGGLYPMDCHPGDHIIYSRLAGVPFEYKGEDLLIINERDIIGILKTPDRREHVASSRTYNYLGMVTDATNATEGRQMALYCNMNGETFVREISEFNDGRFIKTEE